MKIKFDNNALIDDFFENTILIGIVSSIKDYKLCWFINKNLGFDFRLSTDNEIKSKRKEREYVFKIYEYENIGLAQTHILYSNKCDGEFLIPELKNMDYIWLLRAENLSTDFINQFPSLLKSLSEIQLVQPLKIEQIKNKGNLIF